jgi:predicted RNA binding protein YcfA (HicA-like mRNA interferase family)
MRLTPSVWAQLKNLTADRLCVALEKDGWMLSMSGGSGRVYRHHDGRHVAIHYHPGKTFGAALLRMLLKDISWSVADLRRLKLIK